MRDSRNAYKRRTNDMLIAEQHNKRIKQSMTEKHSELRHKNWALESRVKELKVLERNVEGITEWADWIQEDVRSKWPNRHKSRYTRVKVLLVR